MSWVRLDDGFAAHPKVVGLDDRAFRLHICALCYAGQHLTDGAILASQLTFVGDLAGISYPKAFAKKLVAVGLWDTIQDGYQIHDYLKYNSAKADVERERAAARDRMARRRGSNVQPNGSPEGTEERSGTPSPNSKERPSTSTEPSRAPATQPPAPTQHERDNPWKCPGCSIRERSEQALRDHLENVHWLQGDQLEQALSAAST